MKTIKKELYCLNHIPKEKMEAVIVLQDDDLELRCPFPLKEAMCFQSLHYSSLRDKIFDYGSIDSDAVIAELECQTSSWDFAFELEELGFDDKEEFFTKDDSRPFYYGIKGNFEFPEDVKLSFNKKYYFDSVLPYAYSIKQNLFFIDGKEYTKEEFKEFHFWKENADLIFHHFNKNEHTDLFDENF